MSDDAQVFGNAWVFGNAQVFGNAWVSDDAQVSGNAWVFGNAQVFGNAWVFGDAQVSGNAQVSGDAWVSGDLDFILIGPIGSRRAFLTVHADARLKVRFTTGCFTGNKKKLTADIKKTHGTTTLFAKQYKAALALAAVCVKAKKL
jgi:carbonic anhydrase/acetyltransferase-like protein (isoleucine patch superfamily)